MGLVLFFYRLGAPGLMDPDEGRYAEIAREMLVLKDWLIPHLNLLPYLEKPPLVYWLTALGFKVFGYTEAAARLPSAVDALGGVFLAYGLGRAMWGPGPGVLGALVLASTAGYVALGRILTLDMTFALYLNLGIGLGYLALSRGQARLWLWAYLALALAVLTKGPVALVLAGAVWGIWVVLQPGLSPSRSTGREPAAGASSPPPQPSPIQGEGVIYDYLSNATNWLYMYFKSLNLFTANGKRKTENGIKGRVRLRFKQLYQPWSWALLALITLPWFVYVQWVYPEFFRFFIIEQHFGRFLTPAIHPEPLYYYVPVLLGLLLPWTWLLPWTLAAGGRWRDPDERFLVIWASGDPGLFLPVPGQARALHPAGALTSGAPGGTRAGPPQSGPAG